MRFRAFGIALVASIAAIAVHAQTPAPAPLRVIAFDGGWNLPLWAAQRQGFFETNGVSVQLTYTPTSAFLVTSLLDGKFDIALATIDNLIAYQEGQGEAKIADNPDLPAFIQRILGKDYFVMDQWQLEELAKVVERCKVKVVSHGLPPEALRKCFVEPAPTVEQAVADSLAEYGPRARVAVIPKGPYVLPYVA